MTRSLLTAALLILAACDRRPAAPSPPPPIPTHAAKAADQACPLPLHRFNLRGHYQLTGSRPDAPCAAVGQILSAAVRIAHCRPDLCTLELPGRTAEPPPPPPPPPPPLLPDRTRLLGNWVLVSIDGAAPPPGAPPIELIFTDGEVGARSQCVSFAWLTSVEEGRLRLRVPNRLVAMCARALSDWEKAFEAAMAAAARIDSDGREAIVIGPEGRLKLKRPD